ncbi:MAG: VOC family protein [Cyanobium sp.]
MDLVRFHLSIPCHDLEVTRRWYVEGLGCTAGRRSDQALILELGGHQLVAQQLPPERCEPVQPGIYPRHFGLVFATAQAWQELLERARLRGLRFGVEPRCRFEGDQLEHHTFFLIDPSGNWLEFKHYRDPEAALGCRDSPRVGDDELR